MVLRTAVVCGGVVFGFCVFAARYAPQVPVKWVALIGSGYFGLWALDLRIQAGRRHGPYAYRLTTRGIARWRGRHGLLRWEPLRGFWVEFEEETGLGCRIIVLLRTRSSAVRVPLPGDERDAVILAEVRRHVREVPPRVGFWG